MMSLPDWTSYKEIAPHHLCLGHSWLEEIYLLLNGIRIMERIDKVADGSKKSHRADKISAGSNKAPPQEELNPAVE